MRPPHALRARASVTPAKARCPFIRKPRLSARPARGNELWLCRSGVCGARAMRLCRRRSVAQPAPCGVRRSHLVGVGELPVGIAALQRPREGPQVMRLDRIGQRPGDHLSLGIARHRGDIRIEAHRDAAFTAIERRIGDDRPFDRDQAIFQRLARLAPRRDRLAKGMRHVRLGQFEQARFVTRPEGLECHAIRRLRTAQELLHVETGLRTDDRAQPRLGLRFDIAANRLARIRRGVHRAGDHGQGRRRAIVGGAG
ncbi:hypothetical protein WR25_04117 [Diploscapter pachys]|uniref:Uncharacterized protein n=1 Tax=Diploscapter pachys TaxID=2018661 RepID=A0A2A2M3Q9_9BILA|nr:hypothetical protein WR25_04117 [Diploscapter pachys]